VRGAPTQIFLRKRSGKSTKIGEVPEAESKPSHRILVVDDELSISELLSIALRYEGFEVETAADGATALARFEEFRPHLLLLDVMMPGIDGFEVARRLAERRSEVPIIFLTARDTTEDKIRGLTLGGDDYVTKPFSIEELVARIRTILRRAGMTESDGHLRFEGLELEEDTREVFRDGEPVDLTDTEFRLLRYLMLNPRRALTRAQILDHVWNYDFGGDGRILETYISYLRRKADRPDRPLIHTVRGVGYSLRRPRA
jgi:two-component system OmpR family response regulator